MGKLNKARDLKNKFSSLYDGVKERYEKLANEYLFFARLKSKREIKKQSKEYYQSLKTLTQCKKEKEKVTAIKTVEKNKNEKTKKKFNGVMTGLKLLGITAIAATTIGYKIAMNNPVDVGTKTRDPETFDTRTADPTQAVGEQRTGEGDDGKEKGGQTSQRTHGSAQDVKEEEKIKTNETIKDTINKNNVEVKDKNTKTEINIQDSTKEYDMVQEIENKVKNDDNLEMNKNENSGIITVDANKEKEKENQTNNNQINYNKVQNDDSVVHSDESKDNGQKQQEQQDNTQQEVKIDDSKHSNQDFEDLWNRGR